MHPTIVKMKQIVAERDMNGLQTILAEDVRFLPPTYWAEWTGREPVAAILGHVIEIFEDFEYRRVMGQGDDWALEFQCKIGALDCIGVDLLTLNDAGEIQTFEVVMRPHRTIGELRTRMMARIKKDRRFLKYREMMMAGAGAKPQARKSLISRILGR
ncbi:MAG: nuclear transport factor 2 family protein [Pseudomonadota bacterium]